MTHRTIESSTIPERDAQTHVHTELPITYGHRGDSYVLASFDGYFPGAGWKLTLFSVGAIACVGFVFWLVLSGKLA